jgi:hypothetical protein
MCISTLTDHKFAFRGKMEREVLAPASGASEEWTQTGKSSGLPAWIICSQLEQSQAGTSLAVGSTLSLGSIRIALVPKV